MGAGVLCTISDALGIITESSYTWTIWSLSSQNVLSYIENGPALCTVTVTVLPLFLSFRSFLPFIPRLSDYCVSIFDNPRNFSIPSSPSNGRTPFSFSFPRGSNSRCYVGCSRFRTGWSKPRPHNNTWAAPCCSTQIPTPSFQFELDSQLQFCMCLSASFRAYNISGYLNAVQPRHLTQVTNWDWPPWYLGNPVNCPTRDPGRRFWQ
ncbi:hypothetical protein JB92DRAFT_673893 [Gautieria morchelliformis]|nr:hypothetical protein JB92DRAFT_673893 [Gautieria morchelliformis]